MLQDVFNKFFMQTKKTRDLQKKYKKNLDWNTGIEKERAESELDAMIASLEPRQDEKKDDEGQMDLFNA